MNNINLTLCLGAALVASACSDLWAIEILNPLPLEERSLEETKIASGHKALNRQYEEVFSLAEGRDEAGWFTIDLRALCNVNLSSTEGRTCPVQLPYMPLGQQVYYGVPFELIAPEDNENRTALALPSTRLLTTDIPASVQVPVRRNSDALFFLYTTYYTDPEGEQSFTITYTDGSAEKIPFVGGVQAGDWYHPFTRVYSENVHYVLVPAEKGSKTFHRNLHSLQWENPYPEKEIASITLTSDPTAPMAILVLAITGYAAP